MDEWRLNVIPTYSVEDVTEEEPHLVTILVGVASVDHAIIGEEHEIVPLSNDWVGSLRVNALEFHRVVNEFLLILKGVHAESL